MTKQKNKEQRINTIIKDIQNNFFNGKLKDEISNTRTMKVQIDIKKLKPETKNKLDELLNDSEFKRRKILIDLMNSFYNNPQELINKAGKVKEKINKKTGEITLEHKFSSQKLYGALYTKYAKGNSYKNYSSAIFYESILFNVAKEVCSFLDKYYTIQEDINKTIQENSKTIQEKITIKIYSLPETVSNKNECEEYNKIVKQNNILINLHNQQQDDKNKKLQPLKILKGFPSFPLVEKHKELNHTDLEELLLPHVDKAKLFWNTINKNQMQKAMEHIYHSNNNTIYKLLTYCYTIEAEEPTLNNDWKYILKNYKQYDGDIFERIDKKINKIDYITNQDKQAKINWLRNKSLIVLEYLRQNNFEEFAKIRGEFDLKSSMNTGFIAKNNIDRQIFEIIGINEGHKSAILVESIDNKNIYSLAFSVFKDNNKFKIDNNGKFKGFVNFGGSKKKPKEGEENEVKNTQLKNINLDPIGTFILPLNFGKRYAREYLYNKYLNFENKGIILNNARIIKEGEKYFVAITFTKTKGNKFNKDLIQHQHIIGVDRGEKLPVAVAITDLNGNLIEYPKIDISEIFAEKQNNIDKQKREEQSKTGTYNNTLKHKAKNFSKSAIEKIGIQLLYYANKYNGLIVLEDLSRNFGVDPIMAKRQYTKLEDFLIKKLQENGLMYGNVLTNTKSGLLAKVMANLTSKTCSHCGSVFSTEKLENIEPYLKDDGVYYVKLDNKEISLDRDYKQYIRIKGHFETFNANEEITKLKTKDTKKNKELIKKVIINALNPRKTQEDFICPICGHKQNADQQAGLNIARKWLFKDSQEYTSYKNNKNKSNNIHYWQSWENFYKNNIEKWNQNN